MGAKAKTVRENSEYAQMLGRMMRAHGRRIADGDPSDLADAIRLADEFDQIIRQAVADMRAQSGFSWQQLADELGVTRQAVSQRFRGTTPTTK